MPEGDTIHRAARRMNVALEGREIALADAPNPRSPLLNRAAELQGRTLESAEAFGKHLVAHFSGGLALHSHLGMNGRWWIAADGRLPHGRPWLRLASGRAIAAQTGGKILRLISEAKLRNDPALRRLGPDPLRPDFDVAATAARLRDLGAGRETRRRAARPGDRCRGRQRDPGRGLLRRRGQPLAAGRRALRRSARAGGRRVRADHARRARPRPAPQRRIYRADRGRLPGVRRAGLVARPGR